MEQFKGLEIEPRSGLLGGGGGNTILEQDQGNDIFVEVLTRCPNNLTLEKKPAPKVRGRKSASYPFRHKESWRSPQKGISVSPNVVVGKNIRKSERNGREGRLHNFMQKKANGSRTRIYLEREVLKFHQKKEKAKTVGGQAA